MTDLSKAEALFKARQEGEERVKTQEQARLQALREKTTRLRALRLARKAAQVANAAK